MSHKPFGLRKISFENPSQAKRKPPEFFSRIIRAIRTMFSRKVFIFSYYMKKKLFVKIFKKKNEGLPSF